MILIKNMTCEHVTDSLAITTKQPRFSWELESDENNICQTAFKITVYKEEGKLIWDSGKVESSETVGIIYEGEELESVTHYVYQITVWTVDGRRVQSEKQFFETAFFYTKDWKARWIEPEPRPQLPENPLIAANQRWMEFIKAMRRGENPQMFSDADNLQSQPLEPYDPPVRMRRKFNVTDKLKYARLYMTAHGIYEVKINGKPVTNAVLQPGFTTYDKRLKYQVYPLETLLRKGENSIAVTIADGWYKGKIALGRGCEYGEVLGLLLQIELVDESGTKEIICSDKEWRYTYDGPVIMSDLFLGETVDGRKFDGEPSLCEYNDSMWKYVQVKQEADDTLEAQIEPFAKVFEKIPAKKVWTAPNGDLLVDFGQNMAGFIEVHLSGGAGEEIIFEHGEVLDKDGNFTYMYVNDETRAQRDTYICAGNGEEIFKPQFTYHGFRYVRVRGGENWRKEQFTAMAVSSDNSVIGSFACSDSQLNQLQHNIFWSQISNNITIPTDCPTREKAGWTGDVLVYGATALFNQDMTAFYEDWLRSIRAEQLENGHVLNTVPLIKNYVQQTMAGSLGWGDVILTLPLTLYYLRGNTKVLQENYDVMGKWMKAMQKAAIESPADNPMGGISKNELDAMPERKKDNLHYMINTGFHFGDWLIPSVKNEEGFSDGPASAFLTMNYVGTSLLAADADMYAKVSEILGYAEIAKEYHNYAARVREAFYEEYVDENGRLGQELQGNYILALKHHMVPKEKESLLAGNLKELIIKNGYRLDTGFMSIPYLLDILCDYGYEETAWKVLWQKNCPSWLYEIEHGATTMWENWDAIAADGRVSECSFNHYAFGCVGDFMYRRLAGIQNAGIGYDTIRIAPLYNCGLKWAEGSYHSPHGIISVRWEKQGDNYVIEGKIPANTSAVLILPDGSKKEIGNGEFHMKTGENRK